MQHLTPIEANAHRAVISKWHSLLLRQVWRGYVAYLNETDQSVTQRGQLLGIESLHRHLVDPLTAPVAGE